MRVTRRASALLVPFVALGFGVAGCGGHRPSNLQTTDLPYTVARIKPSIEAARASNPSLFSIFPNEIGNNVTIRACRIPRGGPVSKVMTLPGTCATALAYQKNGIAVVILTERWHEPNDTSHWWQHTWRVSVSADGKVKATRSSGAAPPQLWS